jgi:kinesin family protein 6/9
MALMVNMTVPMTVHMDCRGCEVHINGGSRRKLGEIGLRVLWLWWWNEQIFSDVERRGLKAVITCSYIEIYNETFRDLLGSEDSDIGISEVGRRMILKGAAQPKVGCSREALELLLQGEKTRHVAGHGMNSRSSRSHTIFTMLISTVTSTGQKLCSKLNLVDLAGSERANKTGVSGAAAREALYINKSLTFLEQVIVALAKKNPGHIPYRSSKLTWFLKDSLGGNCKTVLIANVWNSYHQINETISTCRFAHRMMSVAENAHANHDGFNSVHGNLFKLDPVMQGYLEQVTAAAVAREKAKLLREFEKYGHPWGEATNGLAADERGELEGLRKK